MEPIAIVGIGCRFPKAKNPESFWHLLHNGVDAITQVPKDRWDVNQFYDPEPAKPGKVSSRWGGFLDHVDQFDPNFFGISPREAEHMDPQQRLVLKVAWEALENAGIVPKTLARSQTGVFIGITNADYHRLLYRDFSRIDAYSATGTTPCITANRLSYILDLCGPSLAIDTACSSSLVAVHLACQSLHLGESNLCIVGGVNLILSPEPSITFSQARMMAVDGRCKTFDAKADGYVRGEGCGIIILKRLSDALRDNDNILAIVKGSAINQDGLSNGLTAPNGPSQQAVISQALQNAKVKPGEISYVEAHGTGTSLGDPIEVKALKAVLMTGRQLNQPCWIGSVKTNIGHLEGAAGIAGLIKVVLSLQHHHIPPHLHFQELNPYISLKGTPFAIPTEIQSWNTSAERRYAGVSAFSFGGTNCHLIIEEAPVFSEVKASDANQGHLFTLSAKTDKALVGLAKKYVDFLDFHSDVSLVNLCFTANAKRSLFDKRFAVFAESTTQLRQRLAAFCAGGLSMGLASIRVKSKKFQKIVFLFTGQGSQYVGMGHQLYQQAAVFRQTINECAEILRAYIETPLLEMLYPTTPSNFSLSETAYTQPALFALEYALAKLWQSWGIHPNIVMGHSLGEYVAACVAGVFSLEDALKLVATRANLMQSLPPNGEMVTVFTNAARVTKAIQAVAGNMPVAIAAINGSENTVISGTHQAVTAAIAGLELAGVKSKKLAVSHAFHSPLMEPMLADFERIASQVTYSLPQIDLISNLTGQIATSEIATAAYWVNHVKEPVNFAASIETLHQQGYEVFIEIGAKPTLLAMGRNCLPEKVGVWLPSLRQGHSDWQQILESLAELYLLGVQIDWSGFYQNHSYRPLPLPTYAFQKQRYWVETLKNITPTHASSEELETLLKQTAELLPKILQAFNQQPTTTSLEQLFSEVKPSSKPQQPWLLQSLQNTLPQERLNFLIAQLQNEVASVLHLDASELPEPTQGFFDMGMDSLLAVELKNRLEMSLGHSVSATLAFNYPNIENLALYLLKDVMNLDYTNKSPKGFHSYDNELAWIAAKVEHLTDQETEVLLMQKLANL
ncbi:MAG: acyltransferase domain-containing protein [Nostoc indistinguendum CM1-VF10]|jgi:acyl transferase domain-containing protein|nr:acyltransferase domain-containing protein [Nostoc indistinguendum CM1-VF10]